MRCWEGWPSPGWWQAQQSAGEALRAGTLRLHVRADSDSVYDQTCKLAVRDAVLDLTARLWPEDASPAEARRAAARRLPDIQWAARQALARLGQAKPVQVSLVNMYFDTTHYAGLCPACRPLQRGAGGHRPARHLPARTGGACSIRGCAPRPAAATTTPAETDLVCGDYILRFRVVEWWQQLTASRADRVLVRLA